IADFDRVLALDLIKAAEKAKKEAEQEASQTQSNDVAELSDDPFIREIQEKIALRAAAKKAKNYAEADAIRNELEARGVILTDTAKGTTFTIKQ
ncbi:MAG: cysteine--tRNA ligase, partial [Clostridia bacterium]|nr:cysteine--tRNA ligase [Clostridia bacterium]